MVSDTHGAASSVKDNLDFISLRGRLANRKVYFRVAMIWEVNQEELDLNHCMLFVNISYYKPQIKKNKNGLWRESGSSENFKYGFLDLQLYCSTEQGLCVF